MLTIATALLSPLLSSLSSFSLSLSLLRSARSHHLHALRCQLCAHSRSVLHRDNEPRDSVLLTITRASACVCQRLHVSCPSPAAARQLCPLSSFLTSFLSSLPAAGIASTWSFSFFPQTPVAFTRQTSGDREKETATVQSAAKQLWHTLCMCC